MRGRRPADAHPWRKDSVMPRAVSLDALEADWIFDAPDDEYARELDRSGVVIADAAHGGFDFD